MDLSETSIVNKKCFKICSLAPLNIIHAANSSVLFWNSYQIFAYENLSQTSPKVFVPEMQIKQVTASNSLIICLDKCGNIHTTPLKFIKTTRVKLKIPFLPRAQNVLAIYCTKDNKIISLVKEGNEVCSCLHKDNLELQVIERQVVFDEDLQIAHLMLDQMIIFKCYKITKDCCELKELFKMETHLEDCTINFISFDRRTIYCCLTSFKTTSEQVKLIKLYTFPSRICDIDVDVNNFDVIIGLSIGAIIKLSLKNKAPQTVHLNIALQKFEYNDILIYTDGNSMWKAEGIFSHDKKFKELIPSAVKDFVKCKNHIVATTYWNLIYIYADNESTLKTDRNEVNDYTAADTILNNDCLLDAIFKHVEINKSLIKKLEQEKNMLTILSLANRHDILSKMVDSKILVYDNYQDVIEENSNIVLMEMFEEYFKKGSILFNVQIEAAELVQQFDKMLTQLKTIKVHVSFDCCGRIIKTSCLNVKLLPQSFRILVPLDARTLSNEIKVHLRLTTSLPGVHDVRTKTSIVLYKKSFLLRSEHFIKVDTTSKVILSKENLSIDDLLAKATNNFYGNLFKVNDLGNLNPYSTFVHLPQNFENVLNEKNIFKELGVKQGTFLSQKFKSDDFFKLKSKIHLCVLQKNVTIEIFQEDFTDNYKLKITSVDIQTVHHLRNFFSSLIHDRTKMVNTENGLISSKLYTTVENHQKQLRDCVNNSEIENLKPLIEEFQNNVFGSLII